MKTKTVLTITMNPAVDIGTEADEVIPGEKTRCAEPVIDPGGGGINVTRVLNRLGVDSLALYVAGGFSGQKLTEMLHSEDVKTQVIESPHDTRQNIAIIDNQSGEQYRFLLPGLVPEDRIWQEVLDYAEDHMDEYEYLVGSGSLPDGVPTDFYSRLAKIARDHGKKFVMDTSGEALMKGIENGAYFIKPNKEEFEDLKGMFGVSDDNSLLQKLFESGVQNVVQTFGKEKTVLHTPGKSHEFIPPKIKPRSTIGAGDSFVGGMIAGEVKGYSTNKAIGYGISAAASTLLSEGTDLCEAGEVEEFFDQHFS